MTNKTVIRVTENFLSNLDSIKFFLDKIDLSHHFDQLIEVLFETIIPNLEQFPEIGVNLLSRPVSSMEGKSLVKKLSRFTLEGYLIKEYIHRNYLIMYAKKESMIYLLSIKHHKQLSNELSLGV